MSTEQHNANGCDARGDEKPSRSRSGSARLTNATRNVFTVTGVDCSEEVTAIERALKPVSDVLGIEIVASKVTVFHEGRLSRSVIVEAIGKSGLAVLDGKERGAWLNDDGRPIFILIPVANPTGLVANGVSGVDAGQSHPGLVCSPDPAKSPPLDVFENLFRESL